MFEEYADILSPSEAAEALRIGENALYELLNTGKLKAPEIQSVPGQIELSEDNFAQYYIDESGLLNLLLSIYYIEYE